MSALATGPADVVDHATTSVTVVVVGHDVRWLNALRDAPGLHTGAWNVYVAENGPAALALFRDLASVDVAAIDADLTHPSAPELLDEVRRRSPHTARVLVSQRDARDLTLVVNGSAHQSVSVPAEIGLLVELIEHVRNSAEFELRDPVRTLIGQVDRLPSLPAVYHRLTEIMASNYWTADDLANEVSKDVALTSEVLKLVNSSFYGTASRVTSVSRAIALAGADLIRFVVLGNKMFQDTGKDDNWVDLDRLAERSNAVALGSRALAIRDGASNEIVAASYLAGLVSEVGLLVLGRVPDIPYAIAHPVNVATYPGAERAIFGGDRHVVGAHLLTLWGFDPPVIDAVRSLSTGQLPTTNGLDWYLAAARRLIIGNAVNPAELASPPGANPDLDAALDDLRREALAGAAGTSAGVSMAGHGAA